ncbi:MAG: metallophosphoesterase [Bacilli bacterium]|nr:metallophosphoesterase [Bacilli bacterium]
MIYITGDTHGDIDYKKLLKLVDANLTHKDFLIICGDAGICWSYDSLKYHLDLYNKLGCTVLYVDGNHENFDILSEMPVVEYMGALMHQIDKRIFHIFRGEVLTIDEIKFLCIGGAVSIDKMYRTPHISWWKDEEITNNDVNNAIENLKKVDYKVDYVITHCTDTKTVLKNFGFKRDVCTDQLMFIDRVVEYKKWYFGHYHFDTNIDDKKECLYKRIVGLNIEN